VDEWERLKNPETAIVVDVVPAAASEAVAAVDDYMKDERRLRVKYTAEIFRLIRAMATGDFDEAVGLIEAWRALDPSAQTGPQGEWTKDRFEELAKEYGESGHRGLRTDPSARKAEFTRFEKLPDRWIISQRLVDIDDHNDWDLVVELNVAQTRIAKAPVLKLMKIHQIGFEEEYDLEQIL
jgi:hypothetical protein